MRNLKISNKFSLVGQNEVSIRRKMNIKVGLFLARLVDHRIALLRGITFIQMPKLSCKIWNNKTSWNVLYNCQTEEKTRAIGIHTLSFAHEGFQPGLGNKPTFLNWISRDNLCGCYSFISRPTGHGSRGMAKRTKSAAG